MTTCRIEVANSIGEIPACEWAGLVYQRPFASSGWFRFLEHGLRGYKPCYLLAYAQGELAAAAVCGFQRYYYVPYLHSRLAKDIVQRFLHCFPLFSCENPLTEKSGLFFRAGLAEPTIVEALLAAIREVAFARRAFFLGFDYLSDTEASLLGQAAPDCLIYALSPDTYLDIRWATFDEYVANLNYRKRKNVRREIRRAHAEGYHVERWERYSDQSDHLFPLVGNVHRRHGEAEVLVGPEVYSYMECDLPGTVVLAVYWNGQIVGCETLFRDRDILLPKLVGLDYRHGAMAYALLSYEEIRYAIESGVQRIYMGTTGYDFKRRLGCALESRYYAVTTRSRLGNALLRRIAGELWLTRRAPSTA